MPVSEKKDFEYRIEDTSISTIGDFISSSTSIITQGFTAQDLVNYKGEGQVYHNLSRILLKYTHEEQDKYGRRSDYDNFPLKYGTVIYLPFEKVERDFIRTQSDQVVSVDFNSFLANQLRDNYNNPLNIRAYKNQVKTKGVVKNIVQNVSVFLWSKTLSSYVENGEIKYKDTIVNLSPFIISQSTTNTPDISTFQISIDNLKALYNNGWTIDRKAFFQGANKEYITQKNVYDDNLKRTNFFFDRVVQENDIVFIRFETLLSEKDRLIDIKSLDIQAKDLQGKVYDMIGLVDQVSVTSSHESNDVVINITGRDLMKLLIEDGVYFYPFDYIEDGMFANENDEDRMTRYDGQLISRFQQSYKKLDTSLKFIINALGTIKICSDSLFDSYQNQGGNTDRRSKKFELSQSEKQKRNEITKNLNENSAKSVIDSIVSSREFYGLNDPLNRGVASSLMNEIFVFLAFADNIKKLTRAGWKNFVYNSQPLKANQIPSFLYNTLLTVVTNDPNIVNNQYNTFPFATTAVKKCIDRYFAIKERNNFKVTSFDQVPLKGIWQIISLIVDKTVQNRVLVDSSLGNELGSLINGFRKICQEPFVEFFGDTYGDKYYFTVRKPVFDKNGILSLLNGEVLNEEGEIETCNPIIIDINDEDIETDNLIYGGQAYSWYKLRPQGSMIGGDTMALAYLRAVYFKEYADIWGSKPYDVSSNYIPYFPIVSKDAHIGDSYMLQQGINDLKYLVESNAYLPFVRRGQITLANGDRRIKKGTLVRLTSSNEIGYVVGTTNDFSIQNESISRTTTVFLERIMVEKYVDEKSGGGMSYFNIINTDIPKDSFRKTDGYTDLNKDVLAKWKVNKDVFNFFLKKKQFQ